MLNVVVVCENVVRPCGIEALGACVIKDGAIGERKATVCLTRGALEIHKHC